MKTFTILPNGMIKVYTNNKQTALLFNTALQVNGLIVDGYTQIV